MLLLRVLREESLIFDTFAKNTIEIEPVFGKKLHALNFADHDIVIASRECAWAYIKIKNGRIVRSLFESESCDAKLNNSKIVCSLFDSFIKLNMIGEHSFDFL